MFSHKFLIANSPQQKLGLCLFIENLSVQVRGHNDMDSGDQTNICIRPTVRFKDP